MARVQYKYSYFFIFWFGLSVLPWIKSKVMRFDFGGFDFNHSGFLGLAFIFAVGL
jgi:hypothetical protein